MDSSLTRRSLLGHVLPMFAFLGLLGLVSLCKNEHGGFWSAHPEFWIYPGQTFVCLALLVWFRDCYEEVWLPGGIIFTFVIASAVFLLWIAPQQFLHFAPRWDGFDPTAMTTPVSYWTTLLLRFFRLVVIVPLVEEIFWRGFLLRFLINERFEAVPFGKFTWFSFLAVAICFCFSHSRPDWIGAFITGALYNLVAYRTRSLGSCVLAHALTNLFLGLWIMETRQWGFW
ncbi:MAG: CAAX prenyl protease-related protein [Verrucomicrobiota bacterium]|nr:CAAX prenyl protease-related protein [Verrucomicrobiota bacterium]